MQRCVPQKGAARKNIGNDRSSLTTTVPTTNKAFMIYLLVRYANRNKQNLEERTWNWSPTRWSPESRGRNGEMPTGLVAEVWHLAHFSTSWISHRRSEMREKRNPESLSELNDSERKHNGKQHRMKYPTSYRTARIDGLSIFYREAGPRDAPTLLLLHGLPSSSRMFEPLFARLSDHYHLVAPDYPGFGHSDWPAPKNFAYTFDHYAEIMNHFTEVLGLPRYTLYMQDYGGPVGFRMALAHPERIEALIVQDAVAHNEGLGANWKTRRAFWADRAANESALRTNLLSLQTTPTRHVGSDA